MESLNARARNIGFIYHQSWHEIIKLIIKIVVGWLLGMLSHSFEMVRSVVGLFIKKFLEYTIVFITIRMNHTFVYKQGKFPHYYSF